MGIKDRRSDTVTLICQVCGKEYHTFYGRPDSKYCSLKCYRMGRFGQTPSNKCRHCGRDITYTGNRAQKYCSKECHDKHRIGKPNPGRSNRETRQCSWCGENVTRPA